MSFQSVSLETYCPTISYNFKIKYFEDSHLIDILIVEFHGKYRHGSAGSPDAGFIKGSITTGLSVFDPFSLLIDLRDLEYSWGDDFDISFEETGNRKTAVLVGDKCRRAMSTLSFGVGTDRDIVDNEFFFDDANSAVHKLLKENHRNNS